MTNKKISALTAATTPLAGTEVLPIVQSSATTQVSVANLTAGRSVSMADATLSTGNLVPSTAAKGINFTANTGLGGKTSQLLNWYEEGTWTVVWTSLTGTATNTTGYYTRIGRLVTFSYAVQNAAAAVGTFPATHFTLPIAPAKDSAGQIASQGNSFSGSIDIEASAAYPSNFSANYLVFSGSYIV